MKMSRLWNKNACVLWLTLLLVCISCSHEEDIEVDVTNLTGTWQVIYSGNYVPDGSKQITFNSDGTGIVRLDSFVGEGYPRLIPFTYCIIKTDGISKIKITTNVDVTGEEQVEIWDIRILNSVDMDLYRENLGYSESYKKIFVKEESDINVLAPMTNNFLYNTVER